MAKTIRRTLNPLRALFGTIGRSAAFGVLLALPTLILPFLGLPFWELQAYLLSFLFLAAGFLAGRAAIAGFLGASGAWVGGTLSAFLFQSVFWSPGPNVLLVAAYGGLCALGGAIAGKMDSRRLEIALREQPRNRLCTRCGSRVGLIARKCWSCKSHLA